MIPERPQTCDPRQNILADGIIRAFLGPDKVNSQPLEHFRSFDANMREELASNR